MGNKTTSSNTDVLSKKDYKPIDYMPIINDIQYMMEREKWINDIKDHAIQLYISAADHYERLRSEGKNDGQMAYVIDANNRLMNFIKLLDEFKANGIKSESHKDILYSYSSYKVSIDMIYSKYTQSLFDNYDIKQISKYSKVKDVSKYSNIDLEKAYIMLSKLVQVSRPREYHTYLDDMEDTLSREAFMQK